MINRRKDFLAFKVIPLNVKMLLQSDRCIKESFVEGFKKYPTLRDVFLKTPSTWMRGRAIDDNYHPYWRVHNKLYDLAEFIEKHPGGKQWIETTRGTDITEAFESSHLGPRASSLLPKFLVSDVESPRNSPYSFKEDGFYMTLKRRVYKHLTEKVTHKEKLLVQQQVKSIQNVLLLSFLGLLIATGLTQSLFFGTLAGVLLTININCAHNFFHQRDNWRMYCWDLSLLSSYEWRISHSLSHHIFTNTIWDFELSGFEPFTDFKVYNKGKLRSLMMQLNFFVFPALIFPIEGLKRLLAITLCIQKFKPENLLPFTEVVLLWLSGCSLLAALKLWLFVQVVAGYCFIVVGLTAAHHHTDFYHVGDGKFKYGNDWGLAQIDAVGDRYDVNGSLVLELSAFGNHVLHHLFPTLDHGLLDIIRPVYQKTCLDFGLPEDVVNVESYSQWQLFEGMLRQLSRSEPRPSN